MFEVFSLNILHPNASNTALYAGVYPNLQCTQKCTMTQPLFLTYAQKFPYDGTRQSRLLRRHHHRSCLHLHCRLPRLLLR